jgi:acyl carrier protein
LVPRIGEDGCVDCRRPDSTDAACLELEPFGTNAKILMATHETVMNETDVEQTILAFLRKRVGVELPSADANLIETGILDSMMFVDLIVLIEEEFDVVAELNDLEIENFATVARVARFVVERSPKPPPAGKLPG